jgi:formylglycine-generating enzyme required for sulfatase activity
MPLRILAAFTLLTPAAHLAPGAPAPLAGEKYVTNSIGMGLVKIPAGGFLMGSPATDKDRDAEEQQHEVRITKAFYMGVHEVTQGQFKRVMGYNPSYHSKGGTKRTIDTWYPDKLPAGGMHKVAGLDTSGLPVENVSWEEAKEFCEKLSALPEEKKKGRSYRLPTEAEWEYSCRGPAAAYRTFHTGDTLTVKGANFIDSTLGRTTKVGIYPANVFGLHDMHGNVNEWCSDWAGQKYYEESEKDDPKGPASGSNRVVRGGCWGSSAMGCRSARRSWSQPTYRSIDIGFRNALALPR